MVRNSLDDCIVLSGNDNPVDSAHRSQRLNVRETVPTFSTSGSLDEFYRYDVDATANPDPSFTLIESPDGMTIHPQTGVISWQPLEGQQGAMDWSRAIRVVVAPSDPFPPLVGLCFHSCG